jgi:1-deoxy-D-xylulose-5-phosphate reductoisomerase
LKKILLLGSTGSIGESALSVVRSFPGRFRIVGLSCATRAARLAEQAEEFRPDAVGILGNGACVPETARPEVFHGEEGLLSMIRRSSADLVVNGISGAAGLLPSLAALDSGKDLALANKETLVMAGPLVMEEARRRGLRLLPVDSEHAALFSILRGLAPETVGELILTASGGAFRDRPLDELPDATPAEALAHPTWRMGAKITVDSATLANKGLEVIEAHVLFAVPTERIRVLIHPQSLIHALVRTLDGTLHAEMSTPDMRLPIQNALTDPELSVSPVPALELAGRRIDFLAPDSARFPMLALAYQAAASGLSGPIVYNAANETAVASFLEGRIAFTEIARVVEESLEAERQETDGTLGRVLDIDRGSRRAAENSIARRARRNLS